MISSLPTLTILAICQLPVGPTGSPAPIPASAVRLMDVTGDGVCDKLHFGADGSLRVAMHVGARTYAAILQELPRVIVAHVLVDDLNGDGLLDLYLISPHANVALEGDGTGRFSDATESLGLADSGCGLSAQTLDLDGDGLEDVLLRNRRGDVIFWATGRGFRRDETTPPLASPGSTAGMTPGPQVAFDLALTHEEKRILNHMSLVQLDDGSGNLVNTTIRITGANLQIVNGLGATNGYPADPDDIDPLLTVVNGVGNLIVGYNELGNPNGDARTGSHNVVVGQGNSYTSFGGSVGSLDNTTSGAFASVSGGRGNTASGTQASVSGGFYNTASGTSSSVSGGFVNTASGTRASISGGFFNTASSLASSVSGGTFHTASALASSISGGKRNTTSSAYASVSGGYMNTASGTLSSVSGGRDNTASGIGSSVSGGRSNTASGTYASVSGGRSRTASGTDDWVAGSLFEDD